MAKRPFRLGALLVKNGFWVVGRQSGSPVSPRLREEKNRSCMVMV
jgi:hypothetical protein